MNDMADFVYGIQQAFFNNNSQVFVAYLRPLTLTTKSRKA